MFEHLSAPLMCAPMSIASSVELATACARAGVIAGWQGGTYTQMDEFERYLSALAAQPGPGPAIVNLPARIATEPTGPAKLDLLEQHRVPLVLTSLGDPSAVVERVHGWGGRVIQDVTTMRHAEKAIAVGVDGLMVTCSGAGGHTGFLTPLAFVPAVRRIWDGLLIVAGGIADAAGMAGALALGGDIACMGTRFIATPESGVVEGHRRHIERAGVDGIVVSAAINGVPANWIRDSLAEAGLDEMTIRSPGKVDLPEGLVGWRDTFSAGQSVGLIDGVEPVAGLVARLAAEFAARIPGDGWRKRLAAVEAGWG
ncbi:NAD(P)H-dependent flavin oxidoreductase [Novosphingobium huizhouense]|uniref:NAD(P)H-dependent flavin oxidoreductase n=1 Tax=Novosphingobium huizhouense TaxID=2866625 RepID=UPI001CD8377A|nr:nitronate monooxygenase [Novosphingobium huizhouense]